MSRMINKVKNIFHKTEKKFIANILLLTDLLIIIISYIITATVVDYNKSHNFAFFDGSDIYTTPKTITITIIGFFVLPFILFIYSNKNKILFSVKILFTLFVLYWCITISSANFSGLLYHDISYINSTVNDKCVIIDDVSAFASRNIHFYELLNNGMVYYLGMPERNISGNFEYSINWENDCFEFIGHDDEGEIYFWGKFIEKSN